MSAYFEWLRHDILAVVPFEAKRVLSVGCGAGITESTLVKRGVQVTGIEQDCIAAAKARSNGLTVLEGDVTQVSHSLNGETFDCLIYADVLEHLVNPERTLIDHASLLVPGASIIVSVPNFRHYSVFWRLFVRGDIGYEDAGIFDRTHLRITTRRLVERWLRCTGLGVCEIRFEMAQRREKYLSLLSLGLAKEFLARQVIVVGKKPTDLNSGTSPIAK